MKPKSNAIYMNSVFWISAVVIALLVIWGTVDSAGMSKWADLAYNFTSDAFGWFYLLSVLAIVLFCAGLAVSKYGRIRLGGDHEKPKYSYFTWIGMLFSTGFGAGLVFWGIAEPMSHFTNTPSGMEGLSPEAGRQAMQYSFFNWGIHQWSVFTIVGLTLAYFQYRKNSGGMISDTLNPVIGKRGKKPLRSGINILAVIATVLGVATSVGMGILQINGGLNYVFDIPQNTTFLLLITGGLLLLYLTSALTGLDKGIKFLSILNLVLALGLIAVILFLGPTKFILEVFALGIGDYIQNFFGMSLGLSPYDGNTWSKGWTVNYWAWVIAWSPFVGAFIARISRGRTIREFVFGVLIVPPFIATVWIAVFGGTAIYMDLFQNTNIAGAVQNDVTSALFATFENFPMSTLLSVVFILLIVTFLVTSADSATFVLGMMTTNGNQNPNNTVKAIWGVLMSAIVAVLIISSGLQGLQTASLVAALPLTFILFLMGYSLMKSLKKGELVEVESEEHVEVYEEVASDRLVKHQSAPQNSNSVFRDTVKENI
ncbi:glycine/betaine ABC transporter permease [Sporosarcina sp. P19]|uniref:BCCT family transporter n=1 Tax=Sporosarcina sp. P19 TaxID=2048258 RepID=UPI000C171C1F|nr:BCCT family transporter [Sporosarcina sp. P19]PIC76738.1 glycine/betaine ABC transporter permease [Sporosarcina sp. P19]